MNLGDIVADRYEVRLHLGRGGMQDVYLAFDTRLESEVALKTPQPGQQNKRFRQSAKISARVNHHNVAKTLDYIEGDQPFLVEEYVPGENLDVKLRSFGALDPHLAARVFLHIAKGIAASHHAGVIHRDLKPSNIIVGPGYNLQNLKITDFGIATLTEEIFEEEAMSGDLTRSTSGTIRGALPYMAPEMMFRSKGDNPGFPVDIWSLGALMYQLVTGEYPFGVYLQAAVNVQNRNRRAWPEFMTANPQYKPLAQDIQNLIERCLSYEPENRPNANELVSEISKFCYINVDRMEGQVTNLIQNGFSGFVRGADGNDVFFSMESFYGPNRPDRADNSRICYSCFPGSPRFRAHPVIVLKK
jgi:serine/threonine-protein kinase